MAQRIVFAPIIAALLLGVPTVFAQYQESPLLAARVEAGELPPVEERLPSSRYLLHRSAAHSRKVGPVEASQAIRPCARCCRAR